MSIRTTFKFSASFVALLNLATCADTNLSANGNPKKEPKKQRTNADTNSNDEASQPQVVTGAYLACVQDMIPDTRTGEIGFGCGIYDQKTEQKRDLGGLSLTLAVTSTSGQNILSRTSDAPPASLYHDYLYAQANEGDSLRITGTILGANGQQQLSTDVRSVRVKNITDGFNLKKEYTPQELGAWCSLATQLPDDPQNMQRALVKGSACGASYLCRHGYAGFAQTITCIAGGVSDILGNNTLANAGVCLDASIPNRALNEMRCAQ